MKWGKLDIFSRKFETAREYFMQRWARQRTEMYKKNIHDPATHDGAITHLGPDILE